MALTCIKFNSALAVCTATVLSLFCIQKSIKGEQQYIAASVEKKNDTEQQQQDEEEHALEVFFSATPRNEKIIADAVGLRIEPWGFSNPHLASFLAKMRPSPFILHRDVAASRRVSARIYLLMHMLIKRVQLISLF